MKILLLGEYSNVHATLAEGLRELGHRVTVVSNGDFWKDYPRDIDLSRRNYSRWGGLAYYLHLLGLLPRLRGFDAVQLISPMFLELKAERILPIYKYLRRHNKAIFLGANGIDWYWVNCCTTDKPLRYSDFNINDELRETPETIAWRKEWLGTFREDMNQYMAATCNAIVPGLYEYWVAYRGHHPQKTHFIPYPMKMPSGETMSHAASNPVRVFIGINKTRSAFKGTDIMLAAAKEVARRHPDKMELVVCESVPYAQYEKMMNGCDVLLDQLYSYTPSMNALLAMSKGIVCVGGGEPESYDILPEPALRPIVNVEPTYEDVFQKLESLVCHPKQLPQLKQESVAFVRKHHDYIKVARQYEALYLSHCRA